MDGYQGLSEEERACIHIDGEPTVELDFAGMQPRLLYSWEGIQYAGDPYVLDGDAELRDLFKIVFLAIINSETKASKKRAVFCPVNSEPWPL